MMLMLKDVAVEKFSSCLDSSESESSSSESSSEEAHATTYKEPRKKTRYANWLVLALKNELKERGLFCSHKKGDTFKLVQSLEDNDTGTHGSDCLDFELVNLVDLFLDLVLYVYAIGLQVVHHHIILSNIYILHH